MFFAFLSFTKKSYLGVKSSKTSCSISSVSSIGSLITDGRYFSSLNGESLKINESFISIIINELLMSPWAVFTFSFYGFCLPECLYDSKSISSRSAFDLIKEEYFFCFSSCFFTKVNSVCEFSFWFFRISTLYSQARMLYSISALYDSSRFLPTS